MTTITTTGHRLPDAATVAALAASVRAHERGFCAAANCSYQHWGVASPVGGMFDRAANRGCYVATLLEDVCEDHFGRRPVSPGDRLAYLDGPRSPAAAAAMAAETRLPRVRRRSPMPADTEAAVRAWLAERRDVMRQAEAVGRAVGYRILVTRAGEETRRAERMLARLGPATGLVAAGLAEDRAALVRGRRLEPEGVG